MDYQTLVDLCLARIDNQNDRVEPYVREAIIRQLRLRSHLKLPWMESTFDFTTTADQTAYTAGYTNFPLDIARIDSLRRSEVGSTDADVEIAGPYDISDIRRSQANRVSDGVTPRQWGWHAGTLHLAPGVGYALVIAGDYQRDAMRDTATGDVITTASTTHTNPWFVEGQAVLMNFVLEEVYMGLLKDSDAAGLAGSLARQAQHSIMEARTVLQENYHQMDFVL